jgi:quinol-cytochrome oxidoreductase complex cytochrome b subunit
MIYGGKKMEISGGQIGFTILILIIIILSITSLVNFPGNVSTQKWKENCKTDACKNVKSDDFAGLYTMQIFILVSLFLLFFAHFPGLNKVPPFSLLSKII